MTFIIETGVEKPKKVGGGGSQEKYPFSALEVGDSFFVGGKTTKEMGSVCSSAGLRLNRTFSCRNAERNGQVGVRVWRDELAPRRTRKVSEPFPLVDDGGDAHEPDFLTDESLATEGYPVGFPDTTPEPAPSKKHGKKHSR